MLSLFILISPVIAQQGNIETEHPEIRDEIREIFNEEGILLHIDSSKNMGIGWVKALNCARRIPLWNNLSKI